MLRQPKLDVDGAGSWLIPWAKQQLARLKKFTSYGTRQFNLPTGEVVRVSWGFLDKIRITAAVVAGRFTRTLVGATTVPLRHYYVKQGKLAGFGETHPSDTQVTGTAMLSRDGSTFAYLAAQGGNVGVTIERKQRALQRNTVAGSAPTSAAFAPLCMNYGADLTTGDPSEVLVAVQNGYLSRNGKVALGAVPFATSARGSTPLVYAIASDEPTDVSTIYTLAASGVPQPVIDFYASAPALLTTLDQATLGLTVHVPASPYYAAFDQVWSWGLSPSSMQPSLTPAFDHFGDAPLCVARLPYVSRVESLDVPSFSKHYYTLFWSLRYMVLRWSAGAWGVDRSYDFPEVVYIESLTETAVPNQAWQGGTYLPNSAQTPGLDGASHTLAPQLVVAKGVPAALAWVTVDLHRDPPAFDTINNYTSEGSLSVLSPQLARLWYDGAQLASFSYVGSAGPITLVGRDCFAVTSAGTGFFNVQRAGTGWAAALYSPQQALTSVTPLGAYGVKSSGSNLTHFYAGSTELRSWATLVDPPGAPEVAAYSSQPTSTEDFWFVGNVLWSYDDEGAFKAKTYERVLSSTTTKNVVGGTIVVPTVGVFNIPISAGPVFTDGLTLDGTLYWTISAGAFQSFTPASFDALFGVSGTTFNPDPGNPYVISAAGSASWVTSIRKLKYDSAAGLFKTVKTYSTTSQTFPSRGIAVETSPPAPATTTVSSSDVEMVQDEYLVH